MTEQNRGRIFGSITEAVSRRLTGGPAKVDGFVFEKKGGEWRYRVDSKYFNADREPKVMPVKPQYDTISGVEICGNPHIIIRQESAASPRNPNRPTVSDFKDRTFLEVDNVGVNSPTEVTAYVINVFVFPAISVDLTFAAQTLGGKRESTKIIDAIPYSFNDGEINLRGTAPGNFNGLAYVAHLRVPVDLRDYFGKPKQIGEFEKQQPTLRDTAADSISLKMFNGLFREKLNGIGREVSDVRGQAVTGILLSPIKTHYKLADNILTLGPNPEGEVLIAATYLV